jgi:hypothetical protein
LGKEGLGGGGRGDSCGGGGLDELATVHFLHENLRNLAIWSFGYLVIWLSGYC